MGALMTLKILFKEIYMKIYTDANELAKDFSYWSNACGDLHHNGEFIDETSLPPVLKDAYNNLYSEGDGSYNYLCEYKGKYGIAKINEYHEYTEDGMPDEPDNFDYALHVAEMLEKTDFPIDAIFINKEMGFPGTTPDGTEGDYATELVVFIDPQNISVTQYNELAKWLYANAYTTAIDDYTAKHYNLKPDRILTLKEWDDYKAENGITEWDYPLSEYDHITENAIECEIVRFRGENGSGYEYRFCELPQTCNTITQELLDELNKSYSDAIFEFSFKTKMPVIVETLIRGKYDRYLESYSLVLSKDALRDIELFFEKHNIKIQFNTKTSCFWAVEK